MERFHYRSTNREETEAFLCSAYSKLRVHASSPTFMFAVSRLLVGPFSLDEVDINHIHDADVRQAPGHLILTSIISGHIACSTSTHGRAQAGPGQCLLVDQTDVPRQTRVDHSLYHAAVFDSALLQQTASVGARTVTKPIRFTALRPLSPAADRQLANALAYLRESLLSLTEISPLLASTASQALASSVLAAIPNTSLVDDLALADTRDADSETLRRGKLFIEEYAHLPITLAEIAASIPVTPRALQYAFRRHAGTTPMGYLRRVRLAHAHAALQAADSATGVALTDIAAEWGFLHPSRFAAAYLKAYGVSPRTTLLT
ncbi:helix-turn-helix transcriptional regulator [Streptomyces sp. NPDC005533]|uniref:helix-turn-helix transcriptional regulator n=1 Tax=Streptomyces sp. NPDC005533 TaxID=3364723 RepID=UPI003694670E